MPKIQMRRDSAANWKSVNPILLAGEWALETDTRLMKIGDGTTAYNALPYSTAEDSDEWQKPADWVDIRSGALQNSVYFLVGHSADYSSYPLFSVYAEVSTAANTYDVYVDGVKQATTAGGTVTTLNWQTLSLESGWDVTTPSALRTHIVRVTPTTSTDTLTAIRCDQAAGLQQGVLWVHFSLSNAIKIERLICTDQSTGSNYSYQNKLCQAVTATEKEIMALGDMRGCCYGAASLEEFPPVNFAQNGNSTTNFYRAFGYTKLKKIIIRNAVMRLYQTFDHDTELKEIILENAYNTSMDSYTFNLCKALKRLPTIKSTGHGFRCYVQLSSLENTFIDLSYDNSLRALDFYGDAKYRTDGLKGILVSNSAPFDGSSPQLNVSYTGLDRQALRQLFKSMPYNVGYTVVGNPTIADGVMSNIVGRTNYVKLNAIDAFSGGFVSNSETITRVKVVTTGENIKGVPILGPVKDSLPFAYSITGVDSQGKPRIVFRWTNGSSGASMEVRPASTYTDTWIDMRLRLNSVAGTASVDYKLATDTEWTEGVSTTLYSPNYSSYGNTQLCIGNTPYAFLNGGVVDSQIDISNTVIKVNGVPWFTGKEAMTKTCSVVGCTGTAELTQEDKNIALDKGWELTVA